MFAFQIIDWTLASIRIREADMHSLVSVLNAVSATKIAEIRQQVQWIYEQYFSSLKQIVLTSLDELNDRVFPHMAKNYMQWNIPTNAVCTYF